MSKEFSPKHKKLPFEDAPVGVRRAIAGTVLAAAGISTYQGVEAMTNDSDASEKASIASARAKSTVEFGGEDDGWGQEAATKAVRGAILEASTSLAAQVPNIDMEQVTELPTYDQATEALEIADYEEITPDEGDTLTVRVKVSASESGDVSYKVLDAKINDKPNNQD